MNLNQVPIISSLNSAQLRRGQCAPFTSTPGREVKHAYLKPGATVTNNQEIYFAPDPDFDGDRIKGISIVTAGYLTSFTAGRESKDIPIVDDLTGGILQLYGTGDQVIAEFPLVDLAIENNNGQPIRFNIEGVSWRNSRVKFTAGGTIDQTKVLLFKVFFN